MDGRGEKEKHGEKRKGEGREERNWTKGERRVKWERGREEEKKEFLYFFFYISTTVYHTKKVSCYWN